MKAMDRRIGGLAALGHPRISLASAPGVFDGAP
jgi:hypothetical protein